MGKICSKPPSEEKNRTKDKTPSKGAKGVKKQKNGKKRGKTEEVVGTKLVTLDDTRPMTPPPDYDVHEEEEEGKAEDVDMISSLDEVTLRQEAATQQEKEVPVTKSDVVEAIESRVANGIPQDVLEVSKPIEVAKTTEEVTDISKPIEVAKPTEEVTDVSKQIKVDPKPTEAVIAFKPNKVLKFKESDIEVHKTIDVREVDESSFDDDNDDDDDDDLDDEEKKANEKSLKELKQCMDNNLALFVMNNVLMSVQFFENFEAEMERLHKEMDDVGEGNSVKGTRLRHLLVDKVMEVVGTHVVHRKKHGPMKNKETLLHPLRTYMVYENTHVHKGDKINEVVVYQEPPFYRLAAEHEENNVQLNDSGYVNLKEVESTKEEHIYYQTDDSSVEEFLPRNDEAHYEEIKTPLITSLKIPEEDLYGYTTVLYLSRTKPVRSVRSNITPRPGEIPEQCFRKVKKEILDNQRRTAAGTLITFIYSYLSSNHFIANFGAVWEGHIRQAFNLYQEAKFQGPRITINNAKVTHHITPVLAAKWWPACADDFLQKRKTTKQVVWPAPHMQDRIKQEGVYLLPFGFIQRHGYNAKFETQWRIITPWAESYLLSRTMHAHVRCYLFAVAIFKQFIDEEETCLGVEHTHLIHLLFWQVHADPIAWREEEPAESLLTFLRALYNAMFTKKLKDFFVHGRNLLESTPRGFLLKVQGILKTILENPMPYVLLAMKNLKMMPNFYPELDYSKVYKLATAKNALEVVNPNFAPLKAPPRKSHIVFDETDDNRALAQAKRQQIEEEREKERLDKGSTETINLSGVALKNDNGNRRSELLQIFIKHFIIVAQKSREYGAINQALLFLDHTKQLSRLLAPADIEVARDFRRQINAEKKSAESTVPGHRASESRNRKSSNEGGGHLTLSLHDRILPATPEVANDNATMKDLKLHLLPSGYDRR